MEFKKFEQPTSTTVEVDGLKYFFVGYLVSDENIVIRIRPVTNWIREHGLIGPRGEVYLPRYEDIKKGE